MNTCRFLLSALLAFQLSNWAQAETIVTLQETHLCCGACVTAVGKALEKVEGAKAECDRKEKSIKITAAGDDAAKKALGALAKAGFYGKSDNDKLKVPADLSKLPKSNVARLELTGVHNCCGACTKAIKTAVAAVKGVSGDTVKTKEAGFVVEGDFNATEVVVALQKAGFRASVKGAEDDEDGDDEEEEDEDDDDDDK